MVISKKPLHFILALVFSLLPLFGFSNEEKPADQLSEKQKADKERAEFIQHHLHDTHDFHVLSYGQFSGEEKHISFPLPVIIFDEGFHFFMSSEFHHGEHIVHSNGKYFKLEHDGMIHSTNESGTEDLGRPIDLSITKNVICIIIVCLLMLLLFRNLGKSYKKNGGIATGAGRFMEPLILYIRDEIARPNIGEKHYRKYMSHLLTVFFFIWFLNIFGLLPLGVNVTGNIAITASLALVTYIITTFSANKNYWKHIFWMPGVPAPMKVVLAPIEFLGTIIKPFSLMIRLYANMLAGHVVLMSIIALVYSYNHAVGSPLSLLLAFVLLILEILVAVLQAYIFTMLSALYFGAANEEHHHEDHH